MRNIICLATIVFVTSGCASNSGVVAIGEDTFMVSRQAATGFSGSGTLKAEAFAEATAHCKNLGKSLQVISTYEAKPPYILANFPKAEVQFMCLGKGDNELARPKLKQSADKTVEIKSESKITVESNEETDVYTELLKLNYLLTKKIINQREFEQLKQKILSE
mgnify:CR=1 FL=1